MTSTFLNFFDNFFNDTNVLYDFSDKISFLWTKYFISKKMYLFLIMCYNLIKN